MALTQCETQKSNRLPPCVEINWREKIAFVLASIVILTLTGPFGTYDELPLLMRMLYWTLAVVGVGIVMNTLAYTSLYLTPIQNSPWPLRMVIWVLVGAVPGSAVVFGVVWLFQGAEQAFGPFHRYYLKLCAISSVVALVDLRAFALAGRTKPSDPPGPPGDNTELRLFLNQLKPDIGNDIISISTQDHYLDVTTSGGGDLIYGKIAEAEEKLAALPGVRLHRSHWAAIGHIDRLHRKGSSYVVVLSDGRELPVSRSYLEQVRRALGLVT